MMQTSTFQGFSPQTVWFLKALRKNNDSAWFKAHRTEYENHVLNPSKAFVIAIGERLKAVSPDIMAVPKINRSLFRLNRDTRFSPDKSPYKTHIGIFFWEGSKPRMECSGYYFHLEPPNLMLGVGIHMFPKADLSRFRRAAADPETGPILAGVIESAVEKNGFELGGQHYKRVPTGYEADHPNAEILKHNGLYAGKTEPIPEDLYSDRLVEHCLATYSLLAPLHRWLVGIGVGSF